MKNWIQRQKQGIAALLLASTLVIPLLASAGMHPAFATSISHITIATQLVEVQRGIFDGMDYISLNIGGHEVGPSNCRSNVLRMDSSSNAGFNDQDQISTLALAAILSSDTVIIVVPLDESKCINGKPTFTDLYLL